MSATENGIDDAIRAHAAAEGWTGVITGWLVLVATVDHTGQDETSGLSTIYPGGSMSWPMALGIIEAGRIVLHRGFIEGEP